MPKIVSIHESPEQKRSALSELSDTIEAAIAHFAASHPEMPAVAVIGVLRVIECNFINRL